jgi:DNA-binding GntR family transcriptional regulator
MLDRREGTGSVLPETAHVRVHAGLKEALMNGDFLPGQRLVVRQIAEQFRTSAMPVREAFRQLVSDEALFDHPNRGVIVPEATVARISDLVRVRCNVEGTAAEWAATTISEAEIEELVRLNERMHRCVRGDEMADYLTVNRHFHFAVYRAARSPVLQQIIEKLWLRAGPFLNIVRTDTAYVLGLVHHDEIIDALRRADGQAARRALVADLTEAADIILRAATAPVAFQSRSRTAASRRRSATSSKAPAK